MVITRTYRRNSRQDFFQHAWPDTSNHTYWPNVPVAFDRRRGFHARATYSPLGRLIIFGWIFFLSSDHQIARFQKLLHSF